VRSHNRAMHLSRVALVIAAAAALLAPIPLAAPSHAVGRTVNVFRIWPLGDSITVGGTGIDHRDLRPAWNRTPGGYRGFLSKLLSETGFRHHFVGTWTLNPDPTMRVSDQGHHDGHGGYRIEQVTADLTGVAGGASDNGGHWLTGTSDRGPIYPDIAIIHLGTNDIFQHFDPSRRYPTRTGRANYADPRQRSLFVSDMTARLRHLVETIYSLRPTTRIVLSNVVPMGLLVCDRVTGEYGRAVRRLADLERRNGHSIQFADVWSAFTVRTRAGTYLRPGMISMDTHHPMPKGYQTMARIYREAIFELFGKGNPV